MITTLFATFTNGPERPPRMIRSKGGYFYLVCHDGELRFDGYILWNGEVFRVCQVCAPEDFYDRFVEDEKSVRT